MKLLTKIIVPVLCIILSAFSLKAQVLDTSTTQRLLHYIFQPIDKNQIPTGFLEEYGCPMLPAATFNGTLTDSNRIDMNLWRTLYHQLQTGWTRSTANPLPIITAVNNAIKQNVSSTLPIPIPLLLASYNTVKSNAFTSNLLSYSSSTKKVNDVTGRTQTPYDAKTLFAGCPNKNISTTGSESFIIQSSMVWNNTGKSISQVQIDFANGQGFQTVTIGTAINITYPDTGFKKWTVKVTLSDNSILQCYNEYNVLRIANTNSRFIWSESIKPFTWGDVNAVAGTRTAATVTVNFSNNNYTGTLRKPLIVVEGYDVSTIAPTLQRSNYSVRDFIDAVTFEPGNTFDFNNQLDDKAGYDLVFVNFADGAADIVLNAGAVQEVINRVNANKVIDNRFGNIRQQNVVMGLSMGGLCARYALANMTKNFAATPTETRLLITHDSPHKGANVPLGLQYMIRMFSGVQLFGYNVYDIYPDYNDAIGLLNAPATQQLLLYRATTTNAFTNNTFLDGIYRPMITFGAADPQPAYRFIATANGNECANPLFDPGKTFINLGAGVSAGIYARFLFFKVPILSYKLGLAVEAYALPAAGSTNKIAKVYAENSLKLFGFIDVFKQLYNNTAYAPGNHLAIDGVAGSNYPLLNVDALNQFTNLPIFKIDLYVSFPLGPFLGGYFGVYAYNAGVSYNFTFVSTASALDAGLYITPVFSQKYVNGVNQSYPSTSETFIAQETVANNPSLTNNLHIRFTARNSRWLFNEMENKPNTVNCSAECNNPYYLQGADYFCGNSATYSIPGLQRGSVITWSLSKVGVASLNCTSVCNTVTLTRITNGFVKLTATITNPCTAAAIILSKTINVGLPATAYKLLTIQTLTTLCGWDVNLWNTCNATGFIMDGSMLSYTHELGQIQPYNHLVQENIDYGPASKTYTIAAVNQCGTGSFVTKTIAIPAPWRTGNCTIPARISPNNNLSILQPKVSPNPAINEITVMQDTEAGFVQLRIYNKMGMIKKQISFARKTKITKVDVSTLPNDVYNLQVLVNDKWIGTSFIKK